MKTVALFIDADNISAHHSHDIISTAKRYGTLTIKRVYTNWTKSIAQTWHDECVKYGLLAVQQFDHVAGKNASDMAISVDVIESLFTKNIDTFCLASSDSDFTPLCAKLQEYGKTIIGIGNKNASKSLINVCHEFHYLTKDKDENTVPPVFTKPVDLHHQKHRPNPNNDHKLIKTITNIIQEHGDDGKLNTAKLGQLIRQKIPYFNPSFYGYDKIGELLRVMGDFELDTIGTTQFVSIHQAKAVTLSHQNTPAPTIQSATDKDALLKDNVLTNAISNAIASHQHEDGWAVIDDVERYLSDTFGIISQNYGYENSLELLKNLSVMFDTKKVHGIYYAQDKRTAPAQKQGSPKVRMPTEMLQQDTHLIDILRQGIHAHANEHGWARCANVGSFLREHHICPKDYGYRNLTELVKALAVFDIKTDNNVHSLKDPAAKAVLTAKTPMTENDDPRNTNLENEALENPILENHELETINLDSEHLENISLGSKTLTSENLPISDATDSRKTDDARTDSTDTGTEITNELLTLLSGLDDDSDTLHDAIKQAISALSPDGDWVRASSVSDHLRRHYGIKASDFGAGTFAELYGKLDGIQCQKQGRILLIKRA